MKYRAEDNCILLEVSELVTLARRGFSPSQSFDEDEPTACGTYTPVGFTDGDRVSLTLPFDSSGEHYVLFGSLLKAEGNTVYTAAPVSELYEMKSREIKAQYRGEGFILGYMHALREQLDSVRLVTVYCSEHSRESCETEEDIPFSKLEKFFRKCADKVYEAGRAERERITVRVPSMKGISFPYDKPRAAQSEFIRAAYRTIARGGELYATAPTGTGKTVSALFPAIRALGDGRISKVFYLTPKTTTAVAARECLERFSENGAKIRSVILTAKEKLCTNGSVCRESRRLCPTNKGNRMSEAVMALFDKSFVTVDAEVLKSFANQYTVCPYELALTYSELCDVVICDFNYLFDPQVYIRRFFTRGGDYAFLIDEAHNLGERAREMYSAELVCDAIGTKEVLGQFAKLRDIAESAEEVIRAELMALIRNELRTDNDGKQYAAYHAHSLPDSFFEIFPTLIEAASDELYESFKAKDEEAQMRTSYLREYLLGIKKFYAAMERFDDSFEFFVTLSDGRLSMKIFCLDTGRVIRERLSLGHASVIFSGTLAPLSYYKSVLGGDGSSASLELDSPFVSEQLSVTVMNNITTRYSERERSLPTVCRVIAATLSAKRGNYMIFSPSFAYAKALYELFSKKYPKIRSILQTPDMSSEQKKDFLDEFSADGKYLAAFCVTGGIYSEGIDLAGDRLIGAVIVGIGMPALSFEREAIAAYYEEKLEMGVQYAYLYPGINRVLQAAGRVIRTENDRGVIVLIDDRFSDPLYKKIVPTLWRGMQFLDDPSELRERLDEFWAGVEGEQ